MSQPDNAGQQSLAANEFDMTDAEKAALSPPEPDATAAAAGNAGDTGTAAAAAGTDGTQPAAAAADGQQTAAPPAAGGDAGSAEAVAAAAAAGPGATAGQPEPAAAAAAAAPEQPIAPFVPTYATDERDFKAEIGGVNQKLQELKAQYKKGDLEDEIYEQQYEELRDERGRIERAQDMAAMQAQLNQQSADQSWAYLQRQFLSRPENAAIASSPMRFAAWEQAMQNVVTDAHAAGRQLTDWDILAGARDMLVSEGLMPASVGGAATAPPVAPPPPKPDRTAPLAQVPATLSTVPAAADPGSRSTTDAAAAMDSIEDVESFLAGKSEAERDRILREVPGSFLADS